MWPADNMLNDAMCDKLYAVTRYFSLAVNLPPVHLWCDQIFSSDTFLLEKSDFKVSNRCPKFRHIMDIFRTFPWGLDVWTCYMCHTINVQNVDTYIFEKMCPKTYPMFGHIMDIFWTLLSPLDIFCDPNYKCPKCDQPELNVSIKCPKLGHIMDIFRTFPCSLDAFWT